VVINFQSLAPTSKTKNAKKRSLSEKGTIAALNRCRDLARRIQSGLANKSSEQMTRLQSLADLQVSLRRPSY